MNTKIFVAAVLGLLAGLAAGFGVANSINRSEITALQGQLVAAQSASSGAASGGDSFTIGDDELKAKIAEADRDASNFTYQKNLGRALYRYATMKNDTELLSESLRILTRANSLDPKDYDVLVDLGNAQFDAGYLKKDSAAFSRSRELYEKALASRPDDADVRTDLAISYLLDPAPDLSRAETEFNKALKADPRQVRALGFLTQTYIQLGNWTAAERTLESLKAVDPNNEKTADLASQIAAKRSGPVK